MSRNAIRRDPGLFADVAHLLLLRRPQQERHQPARRARSMPPRRDHGRTRPMPCSTSTRASTARRSSTCCYEASRAEARKGRVTARRSSRTRTPCRAMAGRAPNTAWSSATARREPRHGDSAPTRRCSIDWRRDAGTSTVRLIQVIRNPFDPISVMMVRGRRTLPERRRPLLLRVRGPASRSGVGLSPARSCSRPLRGRRRVPAGGAARRCAGSSAWTRIPRTWPRAPASSVPSPTEAARWSSGRGSGSTRSTTHVRLRLPGGILL